MAWPRYKARRQGYHDEIGRLNAQRSFEAKQANQMYKAQNRRIPKGQQIPRICPACNSAIPMDANICPLCSKDFRIVSSETVDEKENIKFCPHCGKSLEF